ncbi:MAG: hypothetical protein U9P42_07960 [Candidatus Fermentibacteria bacterium]|nr:hypothetical protein [Candidatus Fermentibacteria bacterium]
MKEVNLLPEGVHAPFLPEGVALTPELLEEQENSLMKVLDQIMEKSNDFGITLRTLGSIAFRIKCPDSKYMEYENSRYLTDIDFIGFSKEIAGIQDLFFDLGWEENQTVLRLFGDKRRIFYHPTEPIHSDVFLDKLRFCHEIDFRKRLKIDYPTISIVDLLLEKLQIVEINRKDLVDVMVLLRQFDVSEDGTQLDCIDGKHIARLCSRDWGWWRTATANLEKTRELSKDYLSDVDAGAVDVKIDYILKLINSRKRSLKWKTRSLIGEKMKWYREVEEVERD